MEDEQWDKEFRNMMLKRVGIAVGVIGLAVGSYFYFRHNETIDTKVKDVIVQPIHVRDFYVAKKGDNLKKIGKYAHLSIDSLRVYNPDLKKVVVGDTIYTSR